MTGNGAKAPPNILPMPNVVKSTTGKVTLAIPEKIDDTLSAYRQAMDNEFAQVKTRTALNYRINVTINAVVVALGVLLILVSVYHGFTTGADLFSGITSAVGVADFVTIFLVNPQDKIRRALADFAQMQIIYSTWANQTAAAYLNMAGGGYKDIDAFESSLTTFANQAVSAIENNIGTG